jgi:putative oxidoreductase
MQLLYASDFKIKLENFELTRSENILRIICGAFMFPHALGKFAALGTLSAGTVGFFAKAGFQPPEFWVWLAAFMEVATGVGLVLGICTRYAALGAAGALAVAIWEFRRVYGDSTFKARTAIGGQSVRTPAG